MWLTISFGIWRYQGHILVLLSPLPPVKDQDGLAG